MGVCGRAPRGQWAPTGGESVSCGRSRPGYGAAVGGAGTGAVAMGRARKKPGRAGQVCCAETSL